MPAVKPRAIPPQSGALTRGGLARLTVPAGNDHADDHENDGHEDRTCDDDHCVGIVAGLPAAMNDASEPNATPTTGTITIIVRAWVRPSPTA